jgi:hypothetical protein
MNAIVVNLFYIKRSKPNKKGLFPIYHGTTINGERLEKSTGKFVDPSKYKMHYGNKHF